MSRTVRIGLLLAFAVALGLALRLPSLGQRPLHNDEAVNAVKFGQLWEQGTYKYDPSEYHGPTLEYATLCVNRLTGAADYEHINEPRLRLVTVLFGVGSILVLLPFVIGFG